MSSNPSSLLFCLYMFAVDICIMFVILFALMYLLMDWEVVF